MERSAFLLGWTLYGMTSNDEGLGFKKTDVLKNEGMAKPFEVVQAERICYTKWEEKKFEKYFRFGNSELSFFVKSFGKKISI